ncbi:lytic transglycosylase domain-containing protein [Halieaceae bacterium IMCC11814]|uniref:Lytic transglycosylase domain-containing protein n=2 Tax=Candidatus Marimicrobium litorale TaxID=2518991 RepID=A0ABT3T8U4_9GAMM|nr:lytic transglycosylase domain-containing protein [Candidatus Marimicrobium litorale]
MGVMKTGGRSGVRVGFGSGVLFALLAALPLRADEASAVLSNVPEGSQERGQADIQVFKYTDQTGVRSYSDTPPVGLHYTVMKFDCFACNPTSSVDWNTIPLQLRAFGTAINTASKRYRVDPALVRAVIHAESAFRPQAVSSKGAMGLMQLMPGTAQDMGVANAMAPEENIHGGVKYLARLLDQNRGDTRLATAAYNAGPGAVRRHNGVPPFAETQTYVERVKILHARYRKAMGKRFSGRVIAGAES